MVKKVIKNIIYCTVKDVKDNICDLAIDLNGQSLIDMNRNKALNLLKVNGLIEDGNIIIPKGFELTDHKLHGGAEEYIFNNGFLAIDMSFDGDEDEYIG